MCLLLSFQRAAMLLMSQTIHQHINTNETRIEYRANEGKQRRHEQKSTNKSAVRMSACLQIEACGCWVYCAYFCHFSSCAVAADFSIFDRLREMFMLYNLFIKCFYRIFFPRRENIYQKHTLTVLILNKIQFAKNRSHRQNSEGIARLQIRLINNPVVEMPGLSLFQREPVTRMRTHSRDCCVYKQLHAQ